MIGKLWFAALLFLAWVIIGAGSGWLVNLFWNAFGPQIVAMARDVWGWPTPSTFGLKIGTFGR